jgi:uncharacterized protein YjcR
MELNLFGLKVSIGRNNEIIQEDYVGDNETPHNDTSIIESIIEDKARASILNESTVVGISESVISKSPADIRKMIDSNEIKMGTLIDTLKSDYNSAETHREDEEMGKDTIIGSAMELMTDDCCMV